MLSVIIPAYNVEKYIERCINSVLNQYLKNIEIIVIDDGSKDKTSDICLKISENNKNIIYKKVQNGGCSAARNLGISMAKGKYIAFLDSDDWVDSDMYINMIEEAEKNQADIVICGFKKLDENKNLLSTVKIPKRNNKNEYIDCTTEWFASPCNKIYKRDLLEKNNIRFLLNIYTGEDMFFNFISFFYSKNIISLDEPYYNYFMNQNSVSNNYKNRTDIYIVIRELISFYKRNGVYKENINKIRECFKYHGIMYPFDVLQKLSENKVENWKRFYIKIKEEINRLKEIETIDIKIYYYYRIFRLKMMWLKRFKKMLIEK
ncbi:MAG: glycosyltransferase family 2 protein [Cetobacterium somerae]|uniref:glycosyltransferase family 2 protein n=1 Tax=Cetobacterium somerae TaxID=188913 RepID=UPI002E7BDBBA|nr:glycosyltransferase family 2 protein [Cetobacterium somerae]WVJ01175.1 glycosyltransferase family 2 protein [Cetobacterium somerae]